MKPEEQRIAIAEVCGLKCNKDGYYNNPDHRMNTGLQPAYLKIPDYLHDLNEMHEAEKVLQPAKWNQYCITLVRVIFENPREYENKTLDDVCARIICRASAQQRAEAFLKTIGKWKE